MKIYRQLTAFIPLLLCVMSCIYEEANLTGCPGALQLKFQWIQTEPKIVVDSLEVAFIPTPGDLFYTTVHREGEIIQLDKASYQVVAWEKAAGITLSGATITVPVQADGGLDEPEEFTGGYAFAEVTPNTTGELIVPLYQQTRPLVVRVMFTGGQAAQVTRLDGVVTGIARSRDMQYAFYSTTEGPRYPAYASTFINYNFNRDEDGWFTGRKTLIGIDGEEPQQLTLLVSLLDGTQQELTYNITKDMDYFHVEKISEPWVITIRFHIDESWDRITIVDWITGPESVIVVS